MSFSTPRDTLKTSASPDVWRAYKPSSQSPWNLRRVVHLHRRAGFAATWKELQRDLQAGPEKSVQRIVDGPAIDDRFAEFQRMADLIGDAACRSNQPIRLKAWWVYRMLLAPDPLAERLALLWHNHFATSNRKVNDLKMMRRQNELFRKAGRGPLSELLFSVVRDPAMLIWLDAPANRKGHPNENLARELMELFTLGIGNYGEADIKSAARALTGWTVRDDQFAFKPTLHDDGVKTFLGTRGAYKGDDIVKMLLDHPATSKRLAWRLCQEFMGEGVAKAEHIESLATLLQEDDLRIDKAISVIFRSEIFFSDANICSKAASPVEFVIGAIRTLEQLDPPPPTNELADWMARLGQDLFYPPNVGGWNGGRDWLRTGALIGRSNFAVALADGRFSASRGKPNWAGLASRNKQCEKLADFVGFIAKLLFGGQPSVGWIDRMHRAADEKSTGDMSAFQKVVSAAVSSPEAQIN